MSDLPDRLRSGMRIISPTGKIATITTTSQRDPVYGEPRYRLRYESGVRGNTLYTRDELNELQCTLVEDGI